MNKKAFFLLLLMTSLFACNNKEKTESNLPTLVISDWDRNKDLNISDICDTLIYIPLETTDESPVISANWMKMSKTRIYIADYNIGLKVFSLKGKFLFKIANKGKGPGEFGEFTSFDINEKDEILVNDNRNQKLIFYSNNGEFLKEVRTGVINGEICWFDNKIIVKSIGDDEYNFVVYNNEFELLNNYLPRKLDMLSVDYGGCQYFFKNGNSEMYFTYILNYNVYALKQNGEMEKHLKIDFKELNCPVDFCGEYDYKNRMAISAQHSKIGDSKYIRAISSFVESERIRFFEFDVNNRYWFYVENMRTNKYQIGYPYNDIDDMNLFGSHFVDGERVVFNVEPFRLRERTDKIRKKLGELEWKKYLEKRPHLASVLKNMKEDDNPILIMGRFK